VAETGDTVSSGNLVLDLGANYRFPFRSAQFYGKRMFAFGLATNLSKQPKGRQVGAKISHDKSVEEAHEAELAGLLFSDIVAEGGEK